jgi:hypothetical protein
VQYATDEQTMKACWHSFPNRHPTRGEGFELPNYTLEQIQSDGLPWVLGYLLPVVAANTTITYGRIAELLKKDLELDGPIFSTQIGGVVGTLMNRLHEVDPEIPLINALVVNQGTGAPGIGVDGYLRERFGVTADPLPPARKTKLVARASREVYTYPNWAEVYSDAFGGPVPTVDPVALITGTEQDGLPPASVGKRGGVAESREHKALKAHVLKHPACVGIKCVPDAADDELGLLSGDEVDVYFETGNRIDLIEVKSIRSNWNDLKRGIYQCIKYRAVFIARRQEVTPDMQVISTLVTEQEAPADIRDLAKRHGIWLRTVRVNR